MQRTPKLTWIGGVFFFDGPQRRAGRDHRISLARLRFGPSRRSGSNAWSALRPGYSQRVEPRFADGGSTVHGGAEGSRYDRRRCTGLGQDPDESGHRSMTSSRARPSHASTPKVSLQVQGSRDAFVYLSATRGFKSGGFNPAAREPGRGFRPEFAWSYEGGLKATIAGGRVRANTALFSNDYQDLQVQSFLRPGVPRHQQRRIGDHQGHRIRDGCGDRGTVCSCQGPSPGSTRRMTDYLALLPGGGRGSTRRAII